MCCLLLPIRLFFTTVVRLLIPFFFAVMREGIAETSLPHNGTLDYPLRQATKSLSVAISTKKLRTGEVHGIFPLAKRKQNSAGVFAMPIFAGYGRGIPKSAGDFFAPPASFISQFAVDSNFLR